MSRTHRRSRHAWAALAFATLLATIAFAPAGARAAVTVATPDRCYIHWPGEGSQTIPLSLSGLQPGQQVRVELRVRGTTVSGLPLLTADATGAVSTELSNWTSGLGGGPSRGASASLAVLDLAAGTELATTPVQVANAGLEIDSRNKRYATKRRWIVSGLSRLSGGKNYHASYFRRGKLVGRQMLGKAGECGYLRTRALLIPFAKVGKFQLRVQASRVFRKSQAWMGGTVVQTAKR